METKGLEIKVGLVVLGALVLLVGFVFLLGDVSLGKHHKVYVTYNFAGGMEPGATVKVAGFRAGKVSKVDFLPNELDPTTKKPIYIKLEVQIDDKVWSAIRSDANFHINTQGLIGEQYIEIVAGDPQKPQLEEGITVRGVDPVRTDLLLGRVYGLLGITEGLFDSPEGKEVASSVKNFLHSASALLTVLSKSMEGREKEIGDLVTHLNGLLAEGEEIAKAVKQGVGDGTRLEQSLADVQTLVRRGNVVAEKIDGILATTGTYLEPTLKDARAALTDVRAATKLLSEVGNDPEKIKKAIADVTAAASRMEKIAADAQSLVSQIKNGDGTVAMLLRDSEIYDDLKEMLRDLKGNPWKFLWKE